MYIYCLLRFCINIDWAMSVVCTVRCCFLLLQVSACTEVGCGETTQPQYGNLSVEKPVPRLLLSTSDSLVIVDSDTHKNLTLSRSGAVVDVAYSSHNDHVYWIDETNHLITSRTNASDKTTVSLWGLIITRQIKFKKEVLKICFMSQAQMTQLMIL